MDQLKAENLEKSVFTTSKPSDPCHLCAIAISSRYAVSFQHRPHHGFKEGEEITLFNVLDPSLTIQVMVVKVAANHDVLVFRSLVKEFTNYPSDHGQMFPGLQYLQLGLCSSRWTTWKAGIVSQRHAGFFIGSGHGRKGDSGSGVYDSIGRFLGLAVASRDFIFKDVINLPLTELAEHYPETKIIGTETIFALADIVDPDTIEKIPSFLRIFRRNQFFECRRSFASDQIKDANKLVEEFMLLANMAVARKIEEAFPKIALLRRHPDPRQKVMREMLELAEKIGFPLDGTSSDLLSKSLHKYQGDDEVMSAINQILIMLMMKPMQLAQYSTGTMKSTSGYHHYALNVPLYTHFTSPIRRYADVMVHRLLSASLGYTPTPDKSIQEVERQAQHCNDKKKSAKLCGEASDDTFFGLFIKRLDMARDPVFRERPPPQLLLYWNSPSGRGNVAVEQTIQMCTVVDVVLSALPEPTKYQAVIKMNPNKETRTLLDLYKARSE